MCSQRRRYRRNMGEKENILDKFTHEFKTEIITQDNSEMNELTDKVFQLYRLVV